MTNLPPTAAGAARDSRRGFTLVELLVVIAILAMLAGLITPAVIRALRTSRNAAIRAEINMLHMAMLNYQSEYGSLPPATNADGSGLRHLRRLFPRCPRPDTQLLQASASDIPRHQRLSISPQGALVSWLGGFTVDPTSPLLPPGARVRLYDFDRARIVTETLAYHAAGSKDSPYLYVDAAHYLNFPYLADDPNNPGIRLLTQPGTQFEPKPPLNYKPPTEPDSWYFTLDAAKVRSTAPFNEDTFQILCAGRDGEFGTDDDLSNFWPGTRREYLESLKAN